MDFPANGKVMDVRTLTGIGALGVRCEPSGEMGYGLRNNSGETLDLTVIVGRESGGLVGAMGTRHTSTNDYLFSNNLPSGISVMSGHLAPINGSKRPQVDLKMTTNSTGNCNTSYVEVLALNTQE